MTRAELQAIVRVEEQFTRESDTEPAEQDRNLWLMDVLQDLLVWAEAFEVPFDEMLEAASNARERIG